MVQKLEQKDILGVSHPRVKLEDFFLKIVEEAQAANIQTHGAGRAGAVPEFLQKADGNDHDGNRRRVARSRVNAKRVEPSRPGEPDAGIGRVQSEPALRRGRTNCSVKQARSRRKCESGAGRRCRAVDDEPEKPRRDADRRSERHRRSAVLTEGPLGPDPYAERRRSRHDKG